MVLANSVPGANPATPAPGSTETLTVYATAPARTPIGITVYWKNSAPETQGPVLSDSQGKAVFSVAVRSGEVGYPVVVEANVGNQIDNCESHFTPT